MVAYMKTTIEIAEALLSESTRAAVSRGMTLQAFVEVALRRALEAERRPRQPFRLRKHPCRGNGLQPGLVEGDWTAIRERAYEGHGG